MAIDTLPGGIQIIRGPEGAGGSILSDNFLWIDAIQSGAKEILSTEPTTGLSNGDLYILGTSPTGTNWTGRTEGDLAVYYNSGWKFLTPPSAKKGLNVYVRNNGANYVWSGTEWQRFSHGASGYEFTGGFLDRTTGTAGVSDVGSNVQYDSTMVANKRWLRFGFDSTQQVTNDAAYWSDPTPSPTAGVGLFGGQHMPSGVDSLYDFTFSDTSTTGADGYDGYSNLVDSGDFQYTSANGSYDFSGCRTGDLAIVRFDFNVVPQIENTTVEVGLIWQTRDAQDEPTFTFALTTQPQFYGTNTVSRTFLARPLITAYFASNEDVNARALPAIRADNPVQIQPLTTLCTIVR
jgi:hypothetical protein